MKKSTKKLTSKHVLKIIVYTLLSIKVIALLNNNIIHLFLKYKKKFSKEKIYINNTNIFSKDDCGYFASLIDLGETNKKVQPIKQQTLEFIYQLPPVDISPYVHIIYDNVINFENSQIAIIAHWDPQNILDDYVVYYLKHLKYLDYKIILATDKKIILTKNQKKYLDAVIYRSCDGYDFTSWKAAFTAFPTLISAEEILITNDSVFASIGDLKAVHKVMSKIDCDCWGLCESYELNPHLQSYYIVFKNKCTNHPCFKEFWSKVSTTSVKKDVIKYELALALWLKNHNLQLASFLPARYRVFPTRNLTHIFWSQLLVNYKVPILKRDLVVKYQNKDKEFLQTMSSLAGLEQVLKTKNYPIKLITNYLDRIKNK